MKVQDIWPAIVKRAWIVIVLVLLSTLVAAVVAQVQSPVYKVEIAVSATAPVNKTTGLPDAMTQGAYVALMPSIANFAESIGVAEAVSARLANQGIEITPEELLKKVSAIPEANSTSMKITFTDGSPTRVTDIANAWGDVLVLKTNQTTELYDQEFKNLLLNGNVVFTNRAVVPEKPTQPKTFAYIGLGFFTGLILGLVLVLFIEYFNPHFRNPREVEETLDLPMLGTLPREKGARSTALLPTFGEGSRTWEAYSELRSSLIMPPETAPASILVASAIPFEAGAAIVTNIAASIANTGRRVLLIDCDLRGRALSRLMQASDNPGLSDALGKEEDYRSNVTETEIANLSFLPAGSKRENSTDLLSLPYFHDELREQESRYDKVLLYAPPLTGSVDAAVLAAQTDASLIIIDADRCTRSAAQEAMFSFERLGILPTGVALANVKIKGGERHRRQREAKASGADVPVRTKAAPMVIAPPVVTGEKKSSRRKERREKESAAAAETAASTAAMTEEKPDKEPAAGVATAPAQIEAEEQPAVMDTAVASEPTPAKAVEEPVEPPPAFRAPWTDAATARPGMQAPSWGTIPATSPAGGVDDELRRQIKESVAEDFRRMGETGAPIPKNWLRALNSDKADVRDSAISAITVYYQSFLDRYHISDENVQRITASIIRMMRREGEFTAMGEEEAQSYLRQMLVDAGARFSAPTPAGSAPAPEQRGSEEKGEQESKDDRDLRRQEKRRFRLDNKSGRKAADKDRDSAPQGVDEEGIDWE
jgi:succinoglycan biosynthesis transport protein ExoP